MDDKTLQRKLDQFVKLGDELHDEAKRRYGRSGWLFVEADGAVHIMSGDADPDIGSISDRQQYVEFTAKNHHNIGVGAW